MYPENPEGTQVNVGSMNMGYISDTARNQTHNLLSQAGADTTMPQWWKVIIIHGIPYVNKNIRRGEIKFNFHHVRLLNFETVEWWVQGCNLCHIRTLLTFNNHIRTLLAFNNHIRILLAFNNHIRTLLAFNNHVRILLAFNNHIRTLLAFNNHVRILLAFNNHIRTLLAFNNHIRTLLAFGVSNTCTFFIPT